MMRLPVGSRGESHAQHYGVVRGGDGVKKSPDKGQPNLPYSSQWSLVF